jgi:cytochrome P450
MAQEVSPAYNTHARLPAYQTSSKFWREAVQETKTGSFSFWVGKRHVVGLTGETSRKMFLDNPGLDFVQGSSLRGVGLLSVPPVPEVFKPGFHNGRSYFLRRLIDMQKPQVLKKYLPRFTSDSRRVFDALAKEPSGITNPAAACWRVVFSHDIILFCSEEVADNPKSFESLLHMIDVLQGTSSFTKVFFPWLPTMAGLQRSRRYKYLQSIFAPVVEKRMTKGAPRREDSLQMLIDNGDRKDLIIDFVISAIVIAPTNSRILIGQMLNIMATYPHWQAKVYAEIQAVAKAHGKNPEAPLAKQLDSMPLEAWESGFPSVDLCFKEAIRMWVAIGMMRKNISSSAIPIPGTYEVIPPGSWAMYNTTETHFSEELYPDPYEFKPERWMEGNVDVKKQVYGCEYLPFLLYQYTSR